MDKNIEMYLAKFSNGLRLSEIDKNDIIEEIKNHIFEAISRQELPEKVLAKLGDPNTLAKSYNHSYKLANDEFKFSDILSSLAFYGSVAFSGMFVVTILPVVSITFVLTAIFIIGISITNIIGITNMPFNLGLIPVTGLPQILMAIIISIVLSLIARTSWLGLKKYLKYVSNDYHKRRIK